MCKQNISINIIGAGLAGTEAALVLASLGYKINLYEMKPGKKSEAHHLTTAAELVCSNSLRSNRLENAAGLLKEELRTLNSPLLYFAHKNETPAGGALAVDRNLFSSDIERALKTNDNINYIKNMEIQSLTELQGIIIIATGPLTSDVLFENLKNKLNLNSLYFFDAAAPIISKESLNFDKVFKQSRYNKGEAAYYNCPFTKDEYQQFYEALINAETAEIKDFDKKNIFEGCMPIEVMAKRGYDTMRFGPLKPVGLVNPKDNKEAYACVQLRQDDVKDELYNIVGFQTRLKFSEQKKVFSMIPGLENAEFLRYGVMHRNTFLNSPGTLNSKYQLIINKNIYFAGQITGVEGYIESIASGHLVARNVALHLKAIADNQQEYEAFAVDDGSCIGALACYISNTEHKKFQPMNINFGILKNLDKKYKKDIKIAKFIERSRKQIREAVVDFQRRMR